MEQYPQEAVPGEKLPTYHYGAPPAPQMSLRQAYQQPMVPPQNTPNNTGFVQPPPQAYAQQPQPPMMVPGAGMALPATGLYCPATADHKHVSRSTRGALGLIVGIVGCAMCLPCFLVAIPMDTRMTCKECQYHIKESWGGL